MSKEGFGMAALYGQRPAIPVETLSAWLWLALGISAEKALPLHSAPSDVEGEESPIS
jgi:hypothetical protein